MRTRIALPLLAFILVFAGCGREASRPAENAGARSTDTGRTTAQITPKKVKYTVRLKVSGIAHLVGENGATTRTLVVPNLTKHAHQPLLLSRDNFSSSFPVQCRPQTPGAAHPQQPSADPKTCADYASKYKVLLYFAALPPGISIDLARSGLSPSGGLTFVEDGDPDESGSVKNAECPSAQVSATSLHWLPRLRTVLKAPAGTKLKADFTKANPDPDDVAVRLEITDGDLSSELIPSRNRFRFNVQGKTNPHVQALAQYLVYSFDVDLPETDPEWNLAGVDKDGKEVSLGKFKPLPGEREIVVTLANVVPDEYFAPPTKIDHLPHLAHYREILDWNLPPGVVADKDGACPNATEQAAGGPDILVAGEVECGPDRP